VGVQVPPSAPNYKTSSSNATGFFMGNSPFAHLLTAYSF